MTALAARPRRSLLYLPASNARALEKARGLAADVVILDLEDAVAPAAKDEARTAAVAAAGSPWTQELAIRVNGLGTPWAEADFAAVADSRAEVLVVPKIETADDAAEAVRQARGKPVWVLIETPRALFHALAVADTAGIEGLVAGFADLAKDLGARPAADRQPLLHAASVVVAAARAARILAFDGVFTDIHDPTGLAAEAAQGRAMGFDGKTIIHPGQVESANRAFTPGEDEVAHARELIEAFEEAERAGRGVATCRGKLVEVLHVAQARVLLARIEMIDRHAHAAGA